MTILRVFEQANGDKALAGKMLGISRATLYRKLKRYNIPVKPRTSRRHRRNQGSRRISLNGRRLTSRQLPATHQIAETFAFHPETRRAPFTAE